MKLVPIILTMLLVAGCQPSGEPLNTKSQNSQSSTKPPSLVIDISTPDRALKSYWLAKDILLKAVPEVRAKADAMQTDEFLKILNRMKFEKITTGDVLSAHHGELGKHDDTPSFSEYSREIVDIKQDTESRATAVVKIRNSTAIPPGSVIPDSIKESREDGKMFKYVLEKDADGWKVAQIYVFKEPTTWENIFPAPTDNKSTDTFLSEYTYGNVDNGM